MPPLEPRDPPKSRIAEIVPYSTKHVRAVERVLAVDEASAADMEGPRGVAPPLLSEVVLSAPRTCAELLNEGRNLGPQPVLQVIDFVRNVTCTCQRPGRAQPERLPRAGPHDPGRDLKPPAVWHPLHA